jgi:ketosteroid isomerase-like protein
MEDRRTTLSVTTQVYRTPGVACYALVTVRGLPHRVSLLLDRSCMMVEGPKWGLGFSNGERNTSMAVDSEVGKASDQFYAALNSMANGDAGPMASAWSHSADVTTMHPLGGREVGWDQVVGPWGQVAHLASSGQIALTDQLMQTSGDMAYETGVEKGQMTLAGQQVSINQRVTNVYRREGGAWKIVHHHSDESPGMMDLLKSLQAGQ